MSKDSGGGCKKVHGGQFVKKLFVLAAIVGLFYGALFRVQTRAWPWEDWGAFFYFSKASTKAAFDKGREFTREKVLPKTKDLLARAHQLLEEWDTEAPPPEGEPKAEPAPEPEPEATPDREALGVASARTESGKIEGTGTVPVGEGVPVKVKVSAEATPDQEKANALAWEEGRAKFKAGLQHYQRSSPEMEGSQDELKAARGEFEKSLTLLEKAQEEDPDNHLIERDLEEVQVFLVDCQRRLKVETETY